MSKKKRSRSAPGAARTEVPAIRKPASRQRQAGARLWVILAVACVLAAGACAYLWLRNAAPPSSTIVAATSTQSASPHFVGAKACADCHSGEYTAWQSSQHAKAMQHATDATVLGDFNNARFDYNGIVSTFFRRDGKFFATTDGKDGRMADFEILYTFGLYPLQQYLVAFPDGRVQPLPIAWDARPKEEGGGRWYHLYPNEHITNKDPLHWTRLEQNWNWMCADCHTTKLERNYNATNNTYATKWSEMNVACEACHGPGSNHVAGSKHEPGYENLAAHGLVVALDERKGVTWTPDIATGNAMRSAPLTSQRELGVCAQCHSRRAAFAKGMDHDGRLFDTHDIALLTNPLYFADGQQRDEVYDVGSFLQSKMHARGVTCSDCHDPHSGKLRAKGNAVCAQCHASAKYDVPAHTLHTAGSIGSQCAQCHMPTRDYMVIDPRHDHSIRIPRPDLSAKLDTPNACNDCHRNRDASWAAQAIEHAFGPERKGFQTFGTALHDGRAGAAGAASELMALAADPEVPAIARATALAELRPFLSAAAMQTIEAGLADPDPMVRGAALDTLLAAPLQQRLQLAVGLIGDSSSIVRIKAARVLAIMPDHSGGASVQAQLDKVFEEYIASQQANADRPEAHMNLGLFYSDRRDPSQAEAEYRAALALEPDFVPAYVNLADLYERNKREDDAETILNAGLQQAADNADLTHALGLLRVRQGRTADAIPLLARAAELDPTNPRYAYVYGVALHDTGEARKGIAVLERTLIRFPNNPELLNALASYARDSGDARRADAYAKRLAAIVPPPDTPRTDQ
jgi:predicted CXXCH cytochrome family protein